MKDKKLSAFAILKGKKTKTETASSQPCESTDATVSLKKANSTPAINEDESTSKRFLRAFKGGSFRSTLRGNKHRPTILSDGTGNSPFVAGNEDGVKLTGVKEKEKSAKDASLGLGKKSQSNGSVHSKTVDNKPLLATTPRLPHPPSKHPQESPRLSGARAAAKQKKPLPPVPKVDFSETPKTSSPNLHGSKSVSTPDISGIHQSETSADKLVKKKGKRGLDDGSPDSARKKQRVSSPKPTRIVPPQLLSQPEARKKVSAMHLLDSVTDSQEDARKLFECMIHPVTVDKFFSELWEKKPLLVRRHIRNYNKGWFSTEELDRILHNEFVQFGVNLDVTSYRDGKRETHNPPGRAYRSLVWDFYQNGCSIRLLNPQTYSESVWKMLTTLQEYFGCCVGANVYLTPAGTQGFAPHYDDIEAFILQLEGKKTLATV
ncbi:hypothetical protein DPMN_099504 [Dreissena polymorpha]|uniref:Bifunctional lysine-specific demethylase and histidyl-hydroxylase n=1 Tax=Dreissena polymorpha TaxID=45954 RepID=A0A9D4LFL0_DREPO|nr:hypothetical protein DPMN_099504 [Dreissena polymorpha]